MELAGVELAGVELGATELRGFELGALELIGLLDWLTALHRLPVTTATLALPVP